MAFAVALGATALAACDGNGENIKCTITVIPNGVRLTVQDHTDGLRSIETTSVTRNANVTIPSFAPKTLDPVVVTATKKDPSLSSRLEVLVTDWFFGKKTCDPTVVTVVRGRDHAVTETNIPGEEHVVTIRNGTPSLNRVVITVNDRKTFSVYMRNRTQRSIDVASAMSTRRGNTLSFVGKGGSRDGSATVLMWDGDNGKPRQPSARELSLLQRPS
jgi:hypothetical protein